MSLLISIPKILEIYRFFQNSFVTYVLKYGNVHILFCYSFRKTWSSIPNSPFV